MTRILPLVLLGCAWSLPCLALAPLPARATSTAADAVEIEGQAQIRLDEGRLIVQADYQLRATGGDVVLEGQPLRLPLLAPVVRGVVLDAGTLPAHGQALTVEQEGEVQIARQNGALEVTGRILQDHPASVRVRYPVGLRATALQLGVTGRGRHTWFTVVVQAQDPARVRLAVDRPARLSRYEQGPERLVGASLARPLEPGQVAVFALEDLPGPPRVVRRALLGLGAVLALLAAGVLWSHQPGRGRA